MKMQLTLFTLGAIATAISWTPAVDANAHGISHHHKSRMVHEKRQSYSGKATFYNTETGNAGSCGGFLSNGGYTVALNAVQYHSGWCGKTITISANGKSHSATIQDECPGDGETCKYGALDMSPALFNYFADPSVGVIDISWSVGGAIESVVQSVTGGNKSNSNSNKNSSSNDDDDDNSDDDAAAKKQAAASQAAAEASRSSASAAAYASSTAAAASRSSAAAYASSTSAAAASKASVAAAKSSSRASVSRASVASVSKSQASVSRASVSSVSRASVSSVKAVKSSSSAAAASASAEAARPKNLENFDAIFGGLQQLAMAAQS